MGKSVYRRTNGFSSQGSGCLFPSLISTAPRGDWTLFHNSTQHQQSTIMPNDYVLRAGSDWYSVSLTGDKRDHEAGCRSEPQAAERQRVRGVNAPLQLVDALQDNRPPPHEAMRCLLLKGEIVLLVRVPIDSAVSVDILVFFQGSVISFGL